MARNVDLVCVEDLECVEHSITSTTDLIKQEISNLNNNIKNIAEDTNFQISDLRSVINNIAEDNSLQFSYLKSTVNSMDRKVSDLQDWAESTQNLINHLIKYGKDKINAQVLRTKEEYSSEVFNAYIFEVGLQYIDEGINYTEFNFPIKLEPSVIHDMCSIGVSKVKRLKDSKVKIIITAEKYRRRNIKLFYIVDLGTKSVIYNYIR